MILRTIATGSKSGNCYALTSDSGEILLLDAGAKLSDIKRGIGYRVSDIVGALVSHIHNDHSLCANAFEEMGIDVWQPYLDENKIQKQAFGSFEVQCFDLPHNGVENRGFLIRCDGQRMIYMTDYEYCRYVFKNQQIAHFLIECNYDRDLVSRDLPNYQHKISGHASSETAINFIKANATNSLRTVLFCHMGANTCDIDKTITEVKKIVPRGVYVDYVRKGLTVELKERGCPF